jgi:hypothetical protein
VYLLTTNLTFALFEVGISSVYRQYHICGKISTSDQPVSIVYVHHDLNVACTDGCTPLTLPGCASTTGIYSILLKSTQWSLRSRRPMYQRDHLIGFCAVYKSLRVSDGIRLNNRGE